MKNPKIPSTHHNVSSFITRRWSSFAFSNKPIERTELNKLLEAASWAASSMNEQPWRYLYAHRGTIAFDRMVDVLMDGNQPWAKNAAVLVIALAKRHFARNGKENRHHMHDLGSANTTLLLQAAEEGIRGHMMGGFHLEAALQAFEIDNTTWELGCFIALGYPGEADDLEEPYAGRERNPRERKDLHLFTQEFVQ